MPNDVALLGKARAGKDTIAKRLVEEHGYTRLAFADPLKDLALNVNPVISTTYNVHVRLADYVADVGWELAKEWNPEVRRLLQRLGQGVRSLTRDFWVSVLTEKLRRIDGPVVVTDVRYPNEAIAMRNLGFSLVRVQRWEALTDPLADAHESEILMDDWPTDATIRNTGTLAELYEEADALAR
ncbi:deoxynucleotide monophosphate kinase family protein [Streptomyces sp. NPDC002644]